MNKNIILVGKTHKGKNRVRELGTEWIILRETDKVLFSNDIGPWVMIAPIGKNLDSKESRWVNLKNDPDFNLSMK